MNISARVSIAVAAISTCTGCISISSSDPKPTDWPTVIDSTCHDVIGKYVDDNMAWSFFGFAKEARPGDAKIKFRQFTISFENDNELIVRYIVDGDSVAQKQIPKEAYVCDKGALKFVSNFDANATFDKAPSGTAKDSVEFVKSEQVLYVKHVWSARTSMSIIPFFSTSTTWRKFSGVAQE